MSDRKWKCVKKLFWPQPVLLHGRKSAARESRTTDQETLMQGEKMEAGVG